MEISVKFFQEALVIKITEGKSQQKIVIPAIFSEHLLEKLTAAFKLRSQIKDIEKNIKANELSISSLKSSEEWRKYNEEVIKS